MMAWLRIDDHEALDSRVGELSHDLYRARHALMQLCAREYRDTGIFPARRIVHASYATPTGPKALTKVGLAKLRELGFVRSKDDYTDEELEQIGTEWPTEPGWLRVHKWELYNPPRDGSAELNRRVTAALESNPEASANDIFKIVGGHRKAVLSTIRTLQGGSDTGTELVPGGTDTGSRSVPKVVPKSGSPTGTKVVPELVRAQTRARVPVPSRTTTPQEQEPGGTSDVEVEAGLGSDSAREGLPDSRTPEQHDPGDPVASLLAVIKDADEGTETVLRNLRLPEYAYRQAIEELKPNGRSVRLAVKILHRIRDEIADTKNELLTFDIVQEATAAATNGQTWDTLEAKILNEHPDLVDVAADAFRAAKSLLGAMESRS